MPRGVRKQSESGFYHVMVRGEGRRVLFEDDEDRICFLRLLSSALDKYSAKIHAWCLMSNHVHLLAEVSFDKLPRMMQSITSGYATHYNKEHDHVGHVFAGRYESKPVDDEAYLLQVVRYIHLNPVEEGLSLTCSYEWSSYADYLDDTGFVEKEFALGLLGGVGGFRAFHEGLAAEHMAELARQIARRRPRLSDSEALELAKQAIGADRLLLVKSLDRPARDEVIAELRRLGLSARQVERITGVSRGIVARVKWK